MHSKSKSVKYKVCKSGTITGNKILCKQLFHLCIVVGNMNRTTFSVHSTIVMFIILYHFFLHEKVFCYTCVHNLLFCCF